MSVGGAVVKPDFSEVFQPGNFHRNLLSQGLPGVRVSPLGPNNDNPNAIIQVGNVFGFIISIENIL